MNTVTTDLFAPVSYHGLFWDYGLLDLQPRSMEENFIWGEGVAQTGELAELQCQVFPRGVQVRLPCGASIADVEVVPLTNEPPRVPGRLSIDVIIPQVKEEMVVMPVISTDAGDGGPAFTPSIMGPYAVRVSEVVPKLAQEDIASYLIEVWPTSA